ncbi:substrate-binding domain-containing protein [Rubellicoccus peritrichatus]|uniref:Substrate-binding domain-containing protein n=1 Tax=Rubellicoccus peritrichatus TaxID=3080537 RepID=A0AAQ3LF65_9BACT|nr:substrate-binding domain-containing protein [Puniceicoccus sp. CR14]WOO43582.1 substrate-binding domain-containing protein [Puniceicoccus sp. CR14]
MKTSSKQTLSHQIVENKLRKILAKGNLKPHSSFLSEVEMSERFGVNVATARKAVDRLVQDGLLYKLHRKGTFVAPPARNRLFIVAMTNPNYSCIGKLTPVADRYPNLHWQELVIDTLRSNLKDLKLVFPNLEGALFVRDFPKCVDVMQGFSEKAIPTFFYGSDTHEPLLGNTHALLYREEDIVNMALNHLKEQGVKRIDCMGSSGWAASRARMEFYQKWVKANGYPMESEMIFDTMHQPSGDTMARYSLLKKRFASKSYKSDGFFVTGNELPVVIQAALAAGLRVPEDLKVVGIEDDEDMALTLFPRPTAVRIPFTEDIQTGFKLLSDLRGKQPKEPIMQWSQPYLIKRQST